MLTQIQFIKCLSLVVYDISVQHYERLHFQYDLEVSASMFTLRADEEMYTNIKLGYLSYEPCF